MNFLERKNFLDKTKRSRQVTPCNTCPFATMTKDEAWQYVEPSHSEEHPFGNHIPMLCNQSRCLDGDEPDRECVGFTGIWTTEYGADCL